MAVSKMALFRVTILVLITTGKERIVGRSSLCQGPQYISDHRTENGILRSGKTRPSAGSLEKDKSKVRY
jgi:hypothetical protein